MNGLASKEIEVSINRMGRLTGLDALRGIAALMVVLFHLGRAFHYPWLFPKGYLAVDFFFMLSGYVLARTYEARFVKGLHPFGFVRLRLKRLWPTMAIGTALALPLFSSFSPAQLIAMFVLTLLFVPQFASRDYFPMNGPQWSILFELFANLIHALVLFRLSTKTLAAVALGAMLVTAGAAARAGNLDIGGTTSWFLAGFPRVILSYTAGIILWRVWHDKPLLILPTLATLILAPLTIFILGIVTTGWVGDMAFVVLACPLLIAGGLVMNLGRVGDWLGAMSFPMYAFHAPVIYTAKSLGFGWPISLALVIGAACSTLLRAFVSKRFDYFPPLAGRPQMSPDLKDEPASLGGVPTDD